MKQIRDCAVWVAFAVAMAVIVFAAGMHFGRSVIKINGHIQVGPDTSIDFDGATIEWWNPATNIVSPEQSVPSEPNLK